MKKMIWLVFISYFIIRLSWLTRLPIFNDESIYLDWGWRALFTTHNPFYSLYDAKPPLVLWLFGLSQMFFSSQLLAGRLVSVGFGFVTLLGIILLGKRYFGKRVAIMAGFFYVVTPLFVFFDRQALLESATSAFTIWLFYCLLRFLERQSWKWIIALGSIGAIGLYIKTSTGIFLGITSLLWCMFLIQKKQYTKIFIALIFLTGTLALLLFPMVIQEKYWSTLSSDSRYVFNVAELFHFPWVAWWLNARSSVVIMLFQLTPIIVIPAVYGMYIVVKMKKGIKTISVVWFWACYLFTILVYRSLIERYLISVLPVLVIFAALGVIHLSERAASLKMTIICLSIFIPTGLTILMISSPAQYLLTLGKISPVGLQEYIHGVTSGYGIPETVAYLEQEANNKQTRIMVGYAINTGNPESALTVYFHRHQHILAGYLESQTIQTDLLQYDCLSAEMPLYFVSRENQLAGLDKFFQLQKTIKNPYSTNIIGVYSLKIACRGRTFHLSIGQG